jgi:catechol 2,3-dioxygenase
MATQPIRYGIAPPGFRLPGSTTVGRVRLQVRDLGRSIRYYGRTLGLAVLSRRDPHAELGPPNADRVLVELRARPDATAAPRGGTLGLFHFAILVPDRATLGRILRRALSLGAVSGLADHAVSEAVYLTDPDGLGIEVYADRPRAAWDVGQGGELYMTTKALDVGSLMSAAGEESGSALPADTRMGHVHLHVGDLGEAEAFYHRGLGLDKIVWTYPGALFLSAGGYHHHLGTNTWSRGGVPGESQARLLSWDLEVADRLAADAAAASLKAAGFRPARQDQGWSAADPWGTTVEIRPLAA